MQYRRTKLASRQVKNAVTPHSSNSGRDAGASMPKRVGRETLKPSEPPMDSDFMSTPYITMDSASVSMAKKMPR